MMEAGKWRTVRPSISEQDGSLELLQSAVIDGRRVWRKQLWTSATDLHGRVLAEEMYWAEGETPYRFGYRSLEALMASLQEPIEPNEP